MAVYELDGIAPQIAASAFVHPEAVVIGDVVIGEECFIAPGAVIRGDFGPVTLGNGVSFQDNAVIHVDAGKKVVIGDDVIIGHGAILHDVQIGARTMIGMGAILMFEVSCGEDCVIAAGAFVPRAMRIPAKTIVGGNPAVIIRETAERHLRDAAEGAQNYRNASRRYLKTLKKVSG